MRSTMPAIATDEGDALALYIRDGYEQKVAELGEPKSSGEDALARDFYAGGFRDGITYLLARIGDEVIDTGDHRANVSGFPVTMLDVHDALRALATELGA